MFETREELIDFLLTNDFNEKYSDLEYKYFLLAYKEAFRNIHSINAVLQQTNLAQKNKIDTLEKEKQHHALQSKIQFETINNLKQKIPKKTWLKKLFNKFM